MKTKNKLGQEINERFVTTTIDPTSPKCGQVVRVSNRRPRAGSKWFSYRFLTWDQVDNCEVKS